MPLPWIEPPDGLATYQGSTCPELSPSKTKETLQGLPVSRREEPQHPFTTHCKATSFLLLFNSTRLVLAVQQFSKKTTAERMPDISLITINFGSHV